MCARTKLQKTRGTGEYEDAKLNRKHRKNVVMLRDPDKEGEKTGPGYPRLTAKDFRHPTGFGT